MRIKGFKTQNGIVYCASEPKGAVLSQVDRRLAEGFAALALGAFPALSMGFIDPRGFGCEYPLANAFAVSRKMLKKAGRMDMGLGSMAAIDLACRIKNQGGTVGAAYDIALPQNVGDTADITELLLDAILFDAKYMALKSWKTSFARYLKALRRDPEVGNHSRKLLVKRTPRFLLLSLWYLTLGHRKDPAHASVDLDMMRKRGEAAVPALPDEEPLVSVVVRTRHRPEVLRGALQSLRHQSYKNFECIVIEDGEPMAKEMVDNEFRDLGIIYHATVNNIGRSAAANLGFSMAKGKYINMLDDDDYLFPEHLMAGVASAESGGYGMVFLQSLALLTTTLSKDPYEYDINEVHFMNFPRIDPFTMVQQCLTPNNGVLFERELFEQLGGMREDLDAHEDWNLWLKFMTKAKWTVVPYATSCFLNPYSKEEQRRRDEQYSKYDGMQFEDEALSFSITSDDIESFRKGAVEDLHNLSELGMLNAELERCALQESSQSIMDAAPGDYSAKELRDLYFGFINRLSAMDGSERHAYLSEKFNCYSACSH